MVSIAYNAGSIEAILDLNRNPFTAGLEAARSQAKRFERERFNVRLVPRLDREAYERIRTTLNRTIGRIVIRPTLDREAFERIRRTISRTVGRVTIRPSLDREAFERIRNTINRSVGRITVRITLDQESVARVRAQIEAIRPTINVRIRYDRDTLDELLRRIREANNAADSGAGSFNNYGNSGSRAFNRINGAARIVLMTLPLLLPVAGAAITGLIGLVGALTSAFVTAGAGVGAFALVGTSVFQSLNKAASATTETSAASVAAMNRVDSARKSLARTINSAADSERAAAERVASAERTLTRAQESAKRAQDDLNKARRDAVEELEDLKLALRGAALSEEQAILDLEEAQLRFNAALSEGVSGNELKQLELDVRQAQLAVDETAESHVDLQQASAEFARTGIDGAEGVRNAQERLNDANAQVAEAERDLATARIEQADVEMDNRLAILEAQQELRDAQAAYVKETQAGSVVLSAAMQRAVEALKGVKAEYEALVARTQDPVADAFTANFMAAQQFLKTLDPLVTSTAAAFTTIGNMAREYFGSPHWLNFVDVISKQMNPVLVKMFEILAYLTRGVMNLTIALAPMADWLLAGIVDGMKGFAEWAGNLASDPRFPQWVETAKESLRRFWEFLVAVVKFIFEFSYAMAPLGAAIFDVLSKIFAGLSRMPPEWLNGIAIGLSAIFTTMLFGASGPVGAVIGIIAGVAAALGTLYTSNENIRKGIDDTVASIRDRFAPILDTLTDSFNNKVIPAWDNATTAMRDNLLPVLDRLWDKVDKDIIPALEDLAFTFTDKLLPSVLTFWGEAQPFVAWMVDVFGGEIAGTIEFIVQAFDAGFTTISGLLTYASGVWQGDWAKMGEGLELISEGFWKAIGAIFSLSLDEMQAIYDEWDRNITNSWVEFWGGIKTEQDGSQTVVSGSWNDFWTASARNFQDQLVTPVSTGWVNFWGGVKTEQNGSQTVVTGMWNDFWNGIGAWFAQAIANIQKGWSDFWAGFLTGVQQGVTNVGNEFRRIGNLFRDPINWVINVVLNDGILGAWNTLMGWIGAPALSVARIPNLPMFAAGGPIKGGIPNKDSVPIMTMPGEYVLSKRAVANMGGVNKVEQMHSAARGGRLDGLGQGRSDGLARQALMRAVPADDAIGRAFAYGGVQPHVARAGQEIERLFGPFAGGIGGVGARGNVSDHPAGLALDFMTMRDSAKGNRVTAHLQANAARMMVKYIIWQQRINSGSGWRGMEDRGSPTANHMDHPHVSFLKSGPGGASKGRDFFGDIVAQVVSWWSQIGGQATGLFNGLMPGAIPGLGGPIGDAAKQIPRKAIDKTIEIARTKLESLMTTIFGGSGGGGTMASGPVVEQVRGVAARYGWDQGQQWADLSALIAKESSWNPNAANPTSSARGLFQKMTSLHGPVESTPAGQAQWGLNYIRSKYGSPTGAWAFHRRNNWYKNGGWLMPGETGYNETREPEAIFNRPQLNAIDRAIDGPGTGSRDGLSADEIREIVRGVVEVLDGGDTYNVMLPERATIRELSKELGHRKRAVAKGRYSPR